MSDTSMVEPIVTEAPKNKGGRPKGSGKKVSSSAPDAAEIAYWDSVKASKDAADHELYLEKYPEGFFAELAERRVKQIIMAEATGGEPDEQRVVMPAKRPQVFVPEAPIPHIAPGDEVPRYQLLAPFFAEDHTLYAADKEIEYLGPPNEHMLPVNEAGRKAKREQEEYLDACWGVKCKADGRPVSPRPKELADQIESERNALRASQRVGGVVQAAELPPTRPDLAKTPIKNPRAARIGAVTDGKQFANRQQNVPILGTEGGRYQRQVTQGFGTAEPDAA